MNAVLTRNRLSPEFLKRLHFYRGNPFQNKQADIEGDLEEYFVPTIHFYRLMDLGSSLPRSAVLSAARGAGKTANRKILEACLGEGKLPVRMGYESLPPVLVVTHINFDWLLKSINYQIANISLEAHIEALLRVMVSSLAEHVIRENFTFESSLSPRFGYFLDRYSSLGHPLALEGYLRRVQSLYKPTLKEAEKLVRSACRQADQVKYLDSYGFLSLLEEFLELATPLGFEKLVVLIDRVDELSLTAGHPELVADFVEPLLKEIQILELPNLIFKFFLPDDAVEMLIKRPGVRIGEKIPYYQIQWQIDELVALLEERLIKLSGSGLKDLGQIADSGAKDVTHILARSAKGSPRNLFRLCELLLLHLEDNTKGVERPLITLDLVKKAIESFQLENKQETTLIDTRLDGQTLLDDQVINDDRLGLRINDDFSIQYRGDRVPVNLSPNEISLLRRFLNEPNKVIGHDDLLKGIYPDDWQMRSDSDLTSTIKRLRRKLAKLPGHPEFIQTRRGHGYILNPDPTP